MMLALITEALVYRASDALLALAPVAGVILATVFAVAAATKLADRTATVSEFAALGLPTPALLATVVPPAELIVALLLVFRPAIGAGLAAIALVGFTAVLATVLASGRSVTCGCLGALSRQPVSTATVIRNGVLLVLAALASVGPNPTGLSPALPAVEVAMAAGSAALLALVGAQLLTLRNQIGRLWSVELAGDGQSRGGRRTGRRSQQQMQQSQQQTQHAERAVMNGVVS